MTAPAAMIKRGGGGGGGGGGGAGKEGAGKEGAGQDGAGTQESQTVPATTRRYTVDEALEDPVAFFARCGQPLYLSGALLFAVNEDTLMPDAVPLLLRLARLLRSSNDPHRVLRIVGHTDARGEPTRNDDLSRRRGQQVATWLSERGHIPAAQLKVEGHGEREPLVPETAPAEMQRFNRRVEILVRCKGQQ